MEKLKPKSQSEIQSALTNAIQAAVNYIESDIKPSRVMAQQYYDGATKLEAEEGRSSVVSTKVRDTIRNVKPSLMRIFLANARFVEFVPKNPGAVMSAEAATEYVHWVFQREGGYNVLNSAFHDALLKKKGVAFAYWHDYDVVTTHTHDNLTEDELMILAQDDDVEILEHGTEIVIEIDPTGVEVERPVHSVKLQHVQTEGKLCLEIIPPEDHFISSGSTCYDDAPVYGHRKEGVLADLIEMGFSWKEIHDLDSFESNDAGEEEEHARTGRSRADDNDIDNDPVMRSVTITQAFMKIDAAGNGRPVLYRFICGGTEYKILDMEEWDECPYADFDIDPEAHAFFGTSLADITMNDQDACTSVLRGILDNVALTNNPRQEVVVDQMYDPNEATNNEIGATMRVYSPGAVSVLGTPFIAGDTMPALQYMDGLVEEKTGVTKASMGLDPDALQNTTATGAQLTAQAGQGQIEVMARNLAEGARKLFGLMLRLIIKNSPEEQMMRLNGKFVAVDPRAWDADMDITINVGLGTGKDELKMAALQQTLEQQKEIYMGWGPNNGLVTLTQIRNTLADQLAIGGLRNADRYYSPMDAQTEQQIVESAMAQQAQQAQQPDPIVQATVAAEEIRASAKLEAKNMELQGKAQGDMIKTRANLQVEAQKQQQKQQEVITNLQVKIRELQQADDLKRDQMAQDLILEVGKLYAEHGTAVDVERLRAEQSAPRDQFGNAMM